MKNKAFSVLLIFCFSALGAQAQKFILDYEVQCLGVGSEGTQLIKVWGYAKKQDDAIELAKLFAVHAVIFKGIKTGKGCAQRPLIPEGQGAEYMRKHSNYFEKFFGIRRLKRNGEYRMDRRATGKEYQLYVQLSTDGSIRASDRKKVGRRYKVGVAVSVSRDALRKKLEQEGIIKAMDYGF